MGRTRTGSRARRSGTTTALAAGLLCLLWILAPAPAGAAPDEGDGPPVEVSYNLRLRTEAHDTPAGNPALDRDFYFHNARFRLGLDAARGAWRFHAVLQGAAAFDLPDNGAFGIGPVYTAANDGDTDPSQAGVAELTAGWHGERGGFTLGRQRWADGLETLTGVANLDAVKRRRLAERLIGNWDWVNVGRRYDGVSGELGLGDTAHLSGFAFRPLAGGVDYDDAFEQLDDLAVYGLTLTARHGAWLPHTELRLYGLVYDDERPGALAAAGGAVDVTTWGTSLLAGNDANDLLVWLAWQQGDWGPADHDALAWIVEGGHRFTLADLPLVLRGGIAQASGDDGGNDHGTFFNLLPTNHKFYGSMDFSAFQNLRDLYAELLLGAGKPWSLRLALHRFELVERTDAWYGGSGAFDEVRLGFAPRRPPTGSFSDRHLGDEIDLSATWALGHGFKLDAGVSAFLGGDGGEEVLRADGDGTWAYVQVSWSGH